MSPLPSPFALWRLFKSSCRALALAALGLSMQAAWAGQGGAPTPGPSDCRPRDADSTCAGAVAGATLPLPLPPSQHPVDVLYDGPLGGVPTIGYSYWGYDFIAEQTGTPSPVRQDEYINRSGVPVSITFTFTVPARASCARDCLPGVEFEIGPGWYKVDPPYIKVADTLTATATIRPGDGYGWVIALWQASNPRVTVTAPKGSGATLAEAGLLASLSVADVIPAVVRTCECGDATLAACSDGNRFSNGLLGAWNQSGGGYARAGAFTNCTIVH